MEFTRGGCTPKANSSIFRAASPTVSLSREQGWMGALFSDKFLHRGGPPSMSSMMGRRSARPPRRALPRCATTPHPCSLPGRRASRAAEAVVPSRAAAS
ncbi:hypothetical protein U9M48_023350 [Paspalum notatum var. saurae]|uniref:Uncharacterized protein n=1 Tax=Paspalum notatum var. saurae TaxID=547442 RepID=A0AAQ3TKA3_PASNO